MTRRWLWAGVLLTGALAAGLYGCGAPEAGTTEEATSAPTKTPRPTFTAIAQATEAPSALAESPTSSMSPTFEAPTAIVPTPPTATPTAPPPPTLDATATFPPKPTATPVLHTPTPPAVFQEPEEPDGGKRDFLIIQQGIIPADENGGNGPGGKHLVLLHAVGPKGEPLNGVVFRDVNSGIEAVTGEKGDGHTLIDMWANTLIVEAVRDAETGRAYTSEPTHRLSLSDPVLEDLVAPGYCESVETCQYNPYMWHFSYRIVFQRQW